MPIHTAPSCCICFTTDAAYFVPALLSAKQARRFASPEKAEVIIFGFSMEPSLRPLFAEACAAEGVGLAFVEDDVVEGRSILVSRLLLHRFVPSRHTQFLFMDSDLQVTHSLDPLIDIDISGRRFLAAADPFTFVANDDSTLGRDFQQHLATLGLGPERAGGYFNSGVLRMDRDGWEQIGSEAWELHKKAAGSRFLDQDLLNLVGWQKRLPLSLAWNFPIFLRNCGVEEEIRPNVYHFMSNPKPWHGSFPPWNAAFSRPYVELLERHPRLAPFCPRLQPVKHFLYHLKQRRKRITEGRDWSDGKRRERMRRYQASCIV